ncbi:MAG: hypothetical protein PHQ11_17050, partial [Paludibacter sp.]|nr:hypothetical protein [Paludibacter sp.]
MTVRTFVICLFQLVAFQLIIGNTIFYRDCSVTLIGDSLVVENSHIKRVYSMNNGNLITRFIINKKSGHVWQ